MARSEGEEAEGDDLTAVYAVGVAGMRRWCVLSGGGGVGKIRGCRCDYLQKTVESR